MCALGENRLGELEPQLWSTGEASRAVSGRYLDVGSEEWARTSARGNVSLLLEMLSSWMFVGRRVPGGINVSPSFPLFELESLIDCVCPKERVGESLVLTRAYMRKEGSASIPVC